MILNSVIADITRSSLQVQRSKPVKKTRVRARTPTQRETAVNMSPLITFPGLKPGQSEEGSVQVHPINHLIAKISFLLTCVYRKRLESLGVSIDVIDFSQDVRDP